MFKKEGEYTYGTYISFCKGPKELKRKSDIYSIRSLDGDLLGYIKWFPSWRKYVFYPYQNTVYEETCLREVAEFIEQETKLYKENRKNEKVNAHTANS